MEQKRMVPPVCGFIGRQFRALSRFLMRLKERERLQLWNGSKAKKDETVGKKAEGQMRRRVCEGKEYHQVKAARREERERERVAEGFRRFIQRMVPLEDGPTRTAKEGVT